MAEQLRTFSGQPIMPVTEGGGGSSELSGKRILFFGDSLVAASNAQITNGGFVKIIADRNSLAYENYYSVKSPTNAQKQSVAVKNIALDGSTLQERASESYNIVYRVKHWVDAEYSDIVIIEGGVNDYFHGNKGSVSNSYTAEYDTATALGGLEEILRYCTNLGVKVGYLIMHNVNGVPENYFTDMMTACEKWGVPYVDLRKKAGFFMSTQNTVHGELYSTSVTEEWSATKVYSKDYKIVYEGSTYKSKEGGNVGNVPTNTEYWTLMSRYPFDMTHLNNLGHEVISKKIEAFLKSI